MPLLPKTVLPVEPVRSGAPVQFVKTEVIESQRNTEVEDMHVTDSSKSDGGEKGNAPKSPDRPMGERTFKSMLFSEQRKEKNPIIFY